jgi:hypothetical protein
MEGALMLLSFLLAVLFQLPDGDNSATPPQGDLRSREPRDPILLPGIETAGFTVETGGTEVWAGNSPTGFGFQRYRSIPNGFTLRRLDYRYVSDHAPIQFRFRSTDLGQHDTSLESELELSNRFLTRVEFAGLTRTWAGGGRTLLTEVSPGRLVADPGLRFTLQNASPDSLAGILHGAFANSPYFTVRSQRDRFLLNQGFRLTPNVRVVFNFSREARNGARPTSFGVFERTPTAIGDVFTVKGLEMSEPTRYTTTEYGFTADVTKTHWFAEFEYRRSQFHNRVPSLMYDNPFRITPSQATPAPGVAPLIGGAVGAATGRGDTTVHQASLPPDNRSDLLDVHFAATLPDTTRIAGAAAWSRFLQNVAFLPFTANPAVVVNPGQNGPAAPLTSVQALPRPSLNGNRRRTDSQLAAKKRIRLLELSLRESLNRLDNKTPAVQFPGVVADWDSIYQEVYLGTPARPSVPYYTHPSSFHRNGTELDANLIATKHMRWKNSFSLQDEMRNYRPVSRLSIRDLTSGFSYTPRSGRVFDVQFEKWNRRPDVYQDIGGLENIDIRMFDISRADRTRTRFVTSTPLSRLLSISATGDFSRSTFDPNGLGLHYQNMNLASADLTLQNSSTSVAIGWDHESGIAMQLAAGGTCLPACLRYTRQIQGRTDDFHINIDGSLGEDRVEFQFHYGVAIDRQLMDTANVDPVPASNLLNAVAYSAPPLKYQLGEFRTYVSLRVSRSLGLGVEGMVEPFRLSDFAVAGLSPWAADNAASQQNDASKFLILAAAPGSYVGRYVSAFLRFSF